ncbi:TFIIIC_sub6 domain-containing protein [Caerostris extrusa]|uniref:TFIIIC_sub6 domain-containing protein n=1 Tax=Caerostris extrusa TaxID=172846 RepID=A0AAV4XLZ0_CAEEX|nr:TFIIIC_sub6 domain-containing protein [Caerostris extrusa]
MDDSDSEYDIEETVVLVELNGIIDTDLLLQPQNPTKTWGIDTDEPIFQIGNSSETPENDFEYLCKTDVKLTMRRCFPQDKSVISSKSTESSNSSQVPDKKYKISTGFRSKIKENKTKKRNFWLANCNKE